MQQIFAVLLSLLFAVPAIAGPIVSRTKVVTKNYVGVRSCGSKVRVAEEAEKACYSVMSHYKQDNQVYYNSLKYQVVDQNSSHWQKCADWPLCVTKTNHCKGWVTVRCMFKTKVYDKHRITFKGKDHCADGRQTMFSVYQKGNYANRYKSQPLSETAQVTYTIECRQGTHWCWGAHAGHIQWGCGENCQSTCQNCCWPCTSTYEVNLGGLTCP